MWTLYQPYYSILLYSLIMLIIISNCQIQDRTIPKNVWAYWWQGEENLSYSYKLTIYRNKYLLQAQGWKYHLLDQSTIEKYIQLPKHINFQKFIKKHEGDWIRLKLLYDYGGVWMDCNILILQSLDFLYHLRDNEFVVNKFGSGPLVYGSFMNSYGTREIDTDNQGNIVRLSPGFQISFIAAVPSASLILEARLQLQRFYNDTQGVIKSIDKTLQIENITVGNQNKYYLATNMAFQVCLQRKQHQLDAKFTGKNRKYAVKQYGLWCAENEHGNYQIQHYSSYIPQQNIILMISADINDLQQPFWGQVGPRHFTTLWLQVLLPDFYENMAKPNLDYDQTIRKIYTIIVNQLYPQYFEIHKDSFIDHYIFNQSLEVNKKFGFNRQKVQFKQPLKQMLFFSPTVTGWTVIIVLYVFAYTKYLLLLLLCIWIGTEAYHNVDNYQVWIYQQVMLQQRDQKQQNKIDCDQICG